MMTKTTTLLTLFTCFVTVSIGYNNGEGQFPAMGWNTWCSTNKCGYDVCNEQEVKEIALAMLSNGMFAAGYKRINLDDCWAAQERDANGNLYADPNRFPDGIEPLTQYLHDLGFKFGLYTSAGNETCSSGQRGSVHPPGSYGHYSQDANTFASWNVDYVKLDWCGSDLYNASEQHTEFSQALNATGRPMWLELCRGYGYPPPPYVAQVAQSWRVTGDHLDEWSSTANAIAQVAGQTSMSGKYNWAYNDFLMTGGQGCPDATNSTVVGAHCPGQTDIEYMTEFAMWAITGSPLIVATDVRNMTEIMYTILLNSEIIAVNQEYTHPAGDILMAEDCDKSVPKACQVWTRQLSDSSIAVVFYNAGDLDHTYSISMAEIRPNTWDSNTVVAVRDLWAHENLGQFVGNFTATVKAHGNVFLKMVQVSEYS